jgi:hypothetical protein
LRIPTKKIHSNTNNSNNNGTSARIAMVKSARHDKGIQQNVKNYPKKNVISNFFFFQNVLKPYRHSRSSKESKRDLDTEAIETDVCILT